MAPSSIRSPLSHPWTLPRFRETLRYPWSKSCEGLPPRHIFYDVQFYPYHTSSTSAPVFALVGNREVVICRPSMGKGEPLSHIKVFRDLEPEPKNWTLSSSSILNSCAWNYVDPSIPLISVAGPSGLIKVLDARTGELATTLVGHGGEINDLATHPLYPWILASASGDHSIRIWDLRRKMEKGENACLIICGHGHGHKEAVLTCAWHGLGSYLISGGQDHIVCIWTIPDLSPDSSFFDRTTAGSSRSSSETKVIHYPHFASSAVHSNYVDCVCFYGDLILSKAAEENKIVLWMVTGFNSLEPPPPANSAPSTRIFQDTRSGFYQQEICSEGISPSESQSPLHSPRIPLFSRLLEFLVPFSELFYMRFSLLTPSRQHPHLHSVVAIGNTKTKIFFWDLKGLEIGPGASLTSLNNDEDKANRREGKGKMRVGNFGLNRKLPKSHSVSTVRSESPSTFASQRSSSAHTNTNASSPVPVTTTVPFRGAEVSSLSATTTAGTPSTLSDLQTDRPDTMSRPGKYRINDPFTPIPAHYSHTPNVNFHLLSRQAAWSPCGRWCVVVGESGSKDAMAAIYDRWI